MPLSNVCRSSVVVSATGAQRKGQGFKECDDPLLFALPRTPPVSRRVALQKPRPIRKRELRDRKATGLEGKRDAEDRASPGK